MFSLENIFRQNELHGTENAVGKSSLIHKTLNLLRGLLVQYSSVTPFTPFTAIDLKKKVCKSSPEQKKWPTFAYKDNK